MMKIITKLSMIALAFTGIGYIYYDKVTDGILILILVMLWEISEKIECIK